VAHTASARKRIRQSEARRAVNKSEKSKMKTYIKKYAAAIETKDTKTAEEALRESISVVYKAAGKNVIHKKQAARRVSRMMRKLNALKAN
jgi:small subunit ribosomal protein S20